MKKLKHYKTTVHSGISLFAVILIALVFAGCTSTQNSAGKTLTTEDFKLTYTDKALAGSETNELTLQHPLSISERQMVFQMVSLNYENYSLLGKAGPVFTKEDIKRTKHLLTKALNKAHPQNIISFEVESEDGTTQGQLFASEGKLHWRFFEIRGVKYSLTRNQMVRYGTAWRMVLKKGQKFHVTHKLLGDKQWTNWIEAKIDLPAPENLKTARPKNDSPTGSGQSAPPPRTSSPRTTVPGKNTTELAEKLKSLKYLYENQLINKQEYEQKRKDLLDQNF
ncbi:MAG TPA: SHOCT domain-containing protein [Desulfobacteria bacterium]|nr:SHOCT domain-containing protein [Desulfobacteria bacterium]